jgi:DNA-directed RNA polymerase subunit N (RpoN/RPB10)
VCWSSWQRAFFAGVVFACVCVCVCACLCFFILSLIVSFFFHSQSPIALSFVQLFFPLAFHILSLSLACQLIQMMETLGEALAQPQPQQESVSNPEETDGIRWSWSAYPATRLEGARMVVPLACLYTPLNRHENLPVLPYDPVRCKNCGGVLNPYWYAYTQTLNTQKQNAEKEGENAHSSLPLGDLGCKMYHSSLIFSLSFLLTSCTAFVQSSGFPVKAVGLPFLFCEKRIPTAVHRHQRNESSSRALWTIHHH